MVANTFPSGIRWIKQMSTTFETSPALAAFDWDQTDLYRFFAFAFSPPNEERHQWFSHPGVPDALAALWRRLQCEGEFPGFEWFPNYREYEAAYIALFDVGVPEPPVPLFESAHDKGRPAQELVLENTYFYDVIGLRANPAVSTPDHLVTQLELDQRGARKTARLPDSCLPGSFLSAVSSIAVAPRNVILPTPLAPLLSASFGRLTALSPASLP